MCTSPGLGELELHVGHIGTFEQTFRVCSLEESENIFDRGVDSKQAVHSLLHRTLSSPASVSSELRSIDGWMVVMSLAMSNLPVAGRVVWIDGHSSQRHGTADTVAFAVHPNALLVGRLGLGDSAMLTAVEVPLI